MKWLKQSYSTGTSRRKSKDLPIRGSRYGQFEEKSGTTREKRSFSSRFRTGRSTVSTIPTITKHDIRTFVGEQNFLKGQQSVRDGAIVNPEQQAMALKAYCYGSLPEPFRVQVTFDDTGITTTLCSCSTGTPTDGNRGCEHTATLLLMWKEQPEAFTQMDDIDTILERQGKAQLITLVKQLLQKQPEVEWQLTMPPLPGYKSVPIDTEEYRRQVDAAFRHGGREWDAVYGISSDLYSITETAARFARQRDYTNATAIYEVVAMGTLSHYLSYHDEDGALGRVVQDCVESAYQQHIERLIARRGRANYQVACSYLVKIRSLYEKLDETGQ